MKMNISEAAEKKIQPYLVDGAKLVLDLDDGVGPYSLVGTCTLGTSFRLLVVDQDADLKDYSTKMESNMGDIYIKPYSEEYFTQTNVLNINDQLQTMYVSTNSGILDTNVPVIDERKSALAK